VFLYVTTKCTNQLLVANGVWLCMAQEIHFVIASFVFLLTLSYGLAQGK
jgi:hypothetical protein